MQGIYEEPISAQTPENPPHSHVPLKNDLRIRPVLYPSKILSRHCHNFKDATATNRHQNGNADPQHYTRMYDGLFHDGS